MSGVGGMAGGAACRAQELPQTASQHATWAYASTLSLPTFALLAPAGGFNGTLLLRFFAGKLQPAVGLSFYSE